MGMEPVKGEENMSGVAKTYFSAFYILAAGLMLAACGPVAERDGPIQETGSVFRAGGEIALPGYGAIPA